MSKLSKEQKHKYPLVIVTWDDAESDDGWAETPVELDPKLAVTVGFLVRQTENYVLLAMGYDNGHTHNRFQIPKAIIKDMKELK